MQEGQVVSWMLVFYSPYTPFFGNLPLPGTIASKVPITIFHVSVTLAWKPQCPILLVSVTDLGGHMTHTWPISQLELSPRIVGRCSPSCEVITLWWQEPAVDHDHVLFVPPLDVEVLHL